METLLKTCIEEYLQHLADIGKKPSTIGTSKRALDLLLEALGEGKATRKIMPVHIATFFKSEAATTLNDKPRAKASILQIRRIIRGALVWWTEKGYLDSVPLPKDEKRFVKTEKKDCGNGGNDGN